MDHGGEESMITVPAIRLHQFGVVLYQAILGARDVDRLVRFEVLSYEGDAAHGARPGHGKRKATPSRVNWELLERRIAACAEAYQRPVIRRKIGEPPPHPRAQLARGVAAPRRDQAVRRRARPRRAGAARRGAEAHLHRARRARRPAIRPLPRCGAALLPQLLQADRARLPARMGGPQVQHQDRHGAQSLPARRARRAERRAQERRRRARCARHRTGGRAVGRARRRQPLRDRERVAPEAGGRHARHGGGAGPRAARGAPRLAARERRMRDEHLLYDLSDSPFCMKGRICLHLKGVPYRTVSVTVGRRRELRPPNPLGQVPVLVHGAEVIADSSAIARWAEAHYPDPALIPTDPEAGAYCRLGEEWADEALYFIVGAFKWLNPANRSAALANTVSEVASGALGPLVGWALVRRIRRRYAARGYTAAALGGLETRMRENLGVLAALLGDRPYLLGRSPTLADVAAFAQLSWMRRYAEARLLDGAPTVLDWLDRLAAVPPVAAALSA